MSSIGADWHRIGRPEVTTAFETLGLYDEPGADRETVKKAAHSLLLKYHPDKVKPESKEAADEETKKIYEARSIALAYADEENPT